MRVRLALLTVGTSLLWSVGAWAFCRTTTCASTPPPSYCARDQQGCWVQGAPLFWEQGCVSYAVNEVGVPPLGLDWLDLQALTDEAFRVWLDADCQGLRPTLSVQSLGAVSCNRAEHNPGGPNVNLIVFHQEVWPHENGYLTYGLTTVTFDPDSGRLLGADLELNGANQTFTRDELAYVMAHEIGHFLGIDHTRDTSALMYGSYAFQGAPASLVEDDRAAICTVYPPGRPMPPCKFEPEGGLARDCGGDVYGSCRVSTSRHPPGGRGSLVALAVLGALWLLRRSSRVPSRAPVRAHARATQP